jgi:hypothetical protein
MAERLLASQKGLFSLGFGWLVTGTVIDGVLISGVVGAVGSL